MISRMVIAAALSVVATASVAQDFPQRDLQGAIMWGAGGATDVVARAITPPAEEALGRTIVLTNRAGASGAIATTFVASAPADGYTLLFGAENPQLYGVMGLSELDYRDFYPVNILGRGIGVIVTSPDAPWNSMSELVADTLSRPGEIRMGSTGPGGIPFTIAAMLSTVTDMPVTAVPFEGEGPGLTALQGGHIEFMPVGASAAADLIEAGSVKALAVFEADEVDALPGVPPITDEYPDVASLLPWGPFYGIFVHKDTPEDVKAVLTDAFAEAAATEAFMTLMAERSNIVMNISGDEAQQFLDQWQSSTAWAIADSGAAERSPEEFGIPRP